MGNRLSKIVTKTGDHGETGLAGQTRVPKNHPRIQAVGTADELNSNLGLLMAHMPVELNVIKDEFFKIQHHLFNLGGELVIKDLKVRGSSMVVKQGTMIKGIRIVEGDHNLDCKVNGTSLQLKSEFMKKA